MNLHQRGIVELELESGPVKLKFGTLSFGIFCQMEGIKLHQMQTRLMAPEGFTQINFVYAAAAAYLQLQNEKVPYRVADVAEWIDEVGEERIAVLMAESLAAWEEKKRQQREKMSLKTMKTPESQSPSTSTTV